jgi:hypothetical protein
MYYTQESASIPTKLFELDSFDTDDEFLSLVRQLDSAMILEYCRILERMYALWPCSLNMKYLKTLFFSTKDTTSLPIEYRLEIGKTIFDDIDCIPEKKRIVQFLSELCIHIHISLGYATFQYLIEKISTEDDNQRQLFDETVDGLYTLITQCTLPEHIRCQYIFRSQCILPKDRFSGFLQNFFQTSDLSVPIRLMVCQYVLHHLDHIDENIVDITGILAYIETLLCDIVEFTHVRTDVADMILSVPDKNKHIIPVSIRDQAMSVIRDASGNQFSFYHNNENVHSIENNNITPILHKLQNAYKTVIRQKSLETDIEIVSAKRTTSMNNIDVALIRIQLDNQLYNNLKLAHIFQLIIAYIQDEKNKDIADELWIRLLEELDEMANKCTTGYALRLVNTLSGFDDSLTIRITDEERFRSIFFHKFNKLLEKEHDENTEEYANILYEITIPSSRPESRAAFLKFFRRVFPTLSLEMQEEFKHELTETDIDLYLRKAFCEYDS